MDWVQQRHGDISPSCGTLRSPFDENVSTSPTQQQRYYTQNQSNILSFNPYFIYNFPHSFTPSSLLLLAHPPAAPPLPSLFLDANRTSPNSGDSELSLLSHSCPTGCEGVPIDVTLARAFVHFTAHVAVPSIAPITLASTLYTQVPPSSPEISTFRNSEISGKFNNLSTSTRQLVSSNKSQR